LKQALAATWCRAWYDAVQNVYQWCLSTLAYAPNKEWSDKHKHTAQQQQINRLSAHYAPIFGAAATAAAAAAAGPPTTTTSTCTAASAGTSTPAAAIVAAAIAAAAESADPSTARMSSTAKSSNHYWLLHPGARPNTRLQHCRLRLLLPHLRRYSRFCCSLFPDLRHRINSTIWLVTA
jgi:hypothetical protein